MHFGPVLSVVEGVVNIGRTRVVASVVVPPSAHDDEIAVDGDGPAKLISCSSVARRQLLHLGPVGPVVEAPENVGRSRDRGVKFSAHDDEIFGNSDGMAKLISCSSVARRQLLHFGPVRSVVEAPEDIGRTRVIPSVVVKKGSNDDDIAGDGDGPAKFIT